MAPRKQKKESQITPEKLRQIWSAIPADSWLDFLQHFRAPHQFFNKGKELWGRCIYHNDPHASFHVRFDQGYAKCFGECSTFESDPIAFAAKASGKTYGDAFTYLLNTYGLPGFSASALSEIQDLAHKSLIKRYILSIFNNELKDAATIGRTDPQYEYAQNAVNYLEQRKIPLDALHTLPMGIIPTPSRLWEHLNELEKRTKQRFHSDIQNYLEAIIPLTPTSAGPYAGWLAFANHTTPSNIGLFRIRQPGTKEIRVIQEPKNPDAEMGFFGLGTGLYQTVIGSEHDVAQRAVVVEGEFTALAAIIPQLESGNLQSIIIAAGGNNNHNLDSLQELGFKEALIIGDRDDGGVSFVRSHLKETRTRARVFQWPSHISIGSDLHDVYMQHGGAAVVQAVADDQNYIFPQDWALQRLDVERAVYRDDDVGGLSKLAIRIGKVLNDPSEQEVYVQAAAQLLNIPDSQLKKYVASPDSESGFVALLAQALEKTYRFLYQENTGNGVKIHAWNRAHRKVSSFDLTRRSVTLGVLTGDLGPLIDWVANHVGEPEWIRAFPDKQGNMVEKKLFMRQKEYEGYLVDQAIPRLAMGMPLKSSLTPLGQGIHFKENSLYVVNGDIFCKGTVSEEGGIKWSDVDGPMDGNFYVDQTDSKRARWSNAFSNAEDINVYPPVDIKKLYARARSVFETGWRFDDQALETQYMAAYIFSVPMADAFDALPWIFVNAKYQSGKSFLVLKALSSANNNNRIQLVEASYGTDYFSPAGIRQRMRDSTLMLILDEFEVGHDSGKLKSENYKAREILGVIKGANAGGTTVTMGTASGNFVNFKLRFAFACAGITPLIERADVSRFNHISLSPNERNGILGGTPEFHVCRRFSAEELQEIKFGTTMFALQNFERVRREYNIVRTEAADGNFFNEDTESRFKESLIPILTMMRMAGVNYKQFAQAYSNLKVAKLAETYSMNEYDELWASVMHTTGVRIPKEEYKDRSFTIAELCMDPRKRDHINESGTGVYYIPKKNYLLVRWTTAMSGLLRGSSFAGRSPVSLKGIATLDQRTVPTEVWRTDPHVMSFLRNFQFHYKDVTVIPLHHFVRADVEPVPDAEESARTPGLKPFAKAEPDVF
jgi:hypothetical protein